MSWRLRTSRTNLINPHEMQAFVYRVESQVGVVESCRFSQKRTLRPSCTGPYSVTTLALDKVKHDDDDRRLYAHSMEHLVREQPGICSTDLLTAFSWHRWLAVPKEAARWLVGAVGGDAHRRPRGSRMPSRSSRLVMPHEDLVALALAIRRNGALMRTAEQVVADETPAFSRTWQQHTWPLRVLPSSSRSRWATFPFFEDSRRRRRPRSNWHQL